MPEVLWFVGVNCLLGGAATFGLMHYLKRFDQLAVSKVLIGIILGLCVMSVVLVVPTTIRILQGEGWDGMTSIKFHC